MAKNTNAETKKEKAVREKQALRDSANEIRTESAPSFVIFLCATLEAIIKATRTRCNGRVIADEAEKLGREAGKIEVTKRINGKMKIVYVSDPLKGSLFGLMGLLAACGLATGEVAALLLEASLITERSIVGGEAIEGLALRARIASKSRAFVKTLLSHGVITQDQANMAIDHKVIKGLLLGKTSTEGFDRFMVGRVTGAKVTTVMIDMLKTRLAELRANTANDRKAGVIKKNESHKMTVAEFLAIVQPVGAGVELEPEVQLDVQPPSIEQDTTSFIPLPTGVTELGTQPTA